MPVRRNSGVSFFDGPPSVSCAGYCVRNGRLTPAVDPFDHPLWDHVRSRVAEKTLDIRRQGFFGNAMQSYETLSYGGIVSILQELNERFVIERPTTS